MMILQKINDILYNLLGLNNLTFKLQLIINKRRARKNIVDKKDVICIDENGKFIQ